MVVMELSAIYGLNLIFYLHLCHNVCICVGSFEDNVHLSILLQLAIEAQRLFDDAVADLNVTVNYLPENHDPLPQISDYVESIRISLWDSAFYREFNERGVHKNNTPEKQLNFGSALKRVVYRYFKFVLFPAHAISKSPAFFTDYKDINSERSMYTQGILKSWSTVHLDPCGWYLDCPLKKPPSFEIALRDSLEPSLKSSEPTLPSNITNDTSKKPKPKQQKQKESKPKAIIVDDSDEDTTVMDAHVLHSADVTSPPIQPPAKRLREDPAATMPATVRFVTPPKKRSMLATTGLPSRSTSSMEMIINDSFVRIVEEKTLTKSWPAAYDDILAFLSKVWLLLILSCISSICHINVAILVWCN
jgi:hypothetical protein